MRQPSQSFKFESRPIVELPNRRPYFDRNHRLAVVSTFRLQRCPSCLDRRVNLLVVLQQELGTDCLHAQATIERWIELLDKRSQDDTFSLRRRVQHALTFG